MCSTPNVHLSHLHKLSYLDQNCRSKLYGVLWPSPKTALICVCLMVLCWKIKRSTWVTTLPLYPCMEHVYSACYSFQRIEGGRERRKRERRPKSFFSLIRVSLEQMDSGLSALKNFHNVSFVESGHSPAFCLPCSCLTFQFQLLSY